MSIPNLNLVALPTWNMLLTVPANLKWGLDGGSKVISFCHRPQEAGACAVLEEGLSDASCPPPPPPPRSSSLSLEDAKHRPPTGTWQSSHADPRGLTPPPQPVQPCLTCHSPYRIVSIHLTEPYSNRGKSPSHFSLYVHIVKRINLSLINFADS